MFLRNIIKRSFSIRRSAGEIYHAIEVGSNFIVTQQPIKALADKYYQDESYSLHLQNTHKDFCEELIARTSYKTQKNYFISRVMRKYFDLSYFGQIINKGDELLHAGMLAHFIDKDPELADLTDAFGPNGPDDDEIDMITQQAEHAALLRWVDAIGIHGMLTYSGINLFGFEPDRSERMRKYEVLVKEHLKKLGAEILLSISENDGFKRTYDFSEANKRYELIIRYCNAVETGFDVELENICNEFIDLLEANYNSIKEYRASISEH